MIMQYIFIIAGAWALWSAYTYPIRKVKKFLPTLPEYLETNPMCQTKTGIKCKVSKIGVSAIGMTNTGCLFVTIATPISIGPVGKLLSKIFIF